MSNVLEVFIHVQLGKVGSVDPAPSLLDEINEACWRVCDCFPVWKVMKLEAFKQELQAEDSVLSQVHVGFCTAGNVIALTYFVALTFF